MKAKGQKRRDNETPQVLLQVLYANLSVLTTKWDLICLECHPLSGNIPEVMIFSHQT